ncbi:MAG: hypothetical protein O2968_17520 [Acidobacteria bacterium]|nr:hypothetical protein [Acidobacteriota bacterium]
MVPAGVSNNIDLRSLVQDDIASLIRTYARNATPPIEQTAGGRSLIQFTLRKGTACEPATGVSVWAYETAGGIDGANRVETFSGSEFRDPLGDPYNGSVKLNVPPGGPYTIYARTLEDDNTASAGLYSAFRYSFTTINSNTKTPPGQSTEFDLLASVGLLAAGDTVDLGDIGILNCWAPVSGPAPDLQMDSVTAPADGTVGGQIAVTSDFTNQGSVDAAAFEVGFYFSPDPIITIDDVASVTKCNIAGLLTGAGGTCNGPVDVPSLVPGIYYVGAIADQLNAIGETDESNNSLASALITISPDPLNPIVNGSFETGDFTGWTIKELNSASTPNLPLTVDTAGVQYPLDKFPCGFFCELDYFGSEPTDGIYAALHDFNGDDPATSNTTNRRELFQDVTLPATVTTLEFDYRAAWELFRFGSTMDRVFSVEIEPAGGGALLRPADIILLAVNGGFEQDTDTGIAPNPPYPNGYPDGIVDLSDFAGQAVRIKFVWNIPEPATGFAFFQLDNVRLNATLIPLTDIAITNVVAPASVNEGDSTPVTVTVQNLGNQSVTDNIAVTLSPDGSGGAVTGNPQTIVGGLAVGASTQLQFTWNSAGATGGLHTLTAAHGFSDDNAANNSLGTSVTVNAAPVTDIAITSVSAPASVTVGDTPTVMVTVNNVGNQDVTNLGVSLGATAGSVSPTQTIALTAGASTTLNFTWDTGGATIQDHTLTATHDRLPDDNDTNNSAMATVTVNSTPPPPTIVQSLTTADFSTAEGSIINGSSHNNTHASDGSYEQLLEQQTGRKNKVRSSVTHTWTISVPSGTAQSFSVEAHHTQNSEGDDFTFAYSTDNSTFTNMLTVTKTVDNNVAQTFAFPAAIAGTLYIRVVDTNNSQGNGSRDTLFVDYMDVTTAIGGPDIFPPTAPTGLSALGSDGNVSLDWADNAEPDLEGYRVFRSTTSGTGYVPIGPPLVAVSDFQDDTVANGTTYFYIVTAVDMSNNESVASGEAMATPAAPGSVTSVHVASLVASTVNAGGNRKRGRADAVIVDNLGGLVGSVTVTGTFSGGFNETRSGTTNGSGSATIQTSGTVKGNVNFTFCVDNVTGGLPYQASANVVTCDSP